MHHRQLLPHSDLDCPHPLTLHLCALALISIMQVVDIQECLLLYFDELLLTSIGLVDVIAFLIASKSA